KKTLINAPIRHSQCVGEQKTVEDRYEEEKGSSNEIQVDPVDSFYVTVTKTSKLAKGDTDEAEEDVIEDENILNKSQRRAKAKKKLNEGLSGEETFENKKNKLEELGMQLLSDPEANIRTIKEILPTEKELEMKVSKAVKIRWCEI
ncbi:hypothetical protein HID58_026811, partial [Brassica napus]